jgi:excisionase family DNA binding protein
MVQMLEKNWMTVAQAADVLGCTARHVSFLARDNKLKCSRIGSRLVVVDKKSVEEFAKIKQKTGRPRSRKKS